jgi:endogenous inhibitor of DNA gyrase (YacG/DUF329 family)
MGGLASYLIAKNAKRGSYVPQEQITTAERTIRFRFTCERCGTDSGWDTYEFSGSALTAVKKKADKHKYPFNSKCPWCKKQQSWGAKSLWRYVVTLFAATIIGIFLLLLSNLYMKPWAVPVMIGLPAGISLLTFFNALTRNIRAATVKNKQLPVVDWNGI